MNIVAEYDKLTDGCYFDSITQIVDAPDFLNLLSSRRSDIDDVKYIPPILGSEGWGRYKITFCNEQSSKE